MVHGYGSTVGSPPLPTAFVIRSGFNVLRLLPRLPHALPRTAGSAYRATRYYTLRLAFCLVWFTHLPCYTRLRWLRFTFCGYVVVPHTGSHCPPWFLRLRYRTALCLRCGYHTGYATPPRLRTHGYRPLRGSGCGLRGFVLHGLRLYVRLLVAFAFAVPRFRFSPTTRLRLFTVYLHALRFYLHVAATLPVLPRFWLVTTAFCRLRTLTHAACCRLRLVYGSRFLHTALRIHTGCRSFYATHCGCPADFGLRTLFGLHRTPYARVPVRGWFAAPVAVGFAVLQLHGLLYVYRTHVLLVHLPGCYTHGSSLHAHYAHGSCRAYTALRYALHTANTFTTLVATRLLYGYTPPRGCALRYRLVPSVWIIYTAPHRSGSFTPRSAHLWFAICHTYTPRWITWFALRLYHALLLVYWFTRSRSSTTTLRFWF